MYLLQCNYESVVPKIKKKVKKKTKNLNLFLPCSEWRRTSARIDLYSADGPSVYRLHAGSTLSVLSPLAKQNNAELKPEVLEDKCVRL